MSRPLISTFVLSLLLGACGADLDHAQLGRRRVAVAFGEPDTGHRSVGVVGNGCTGTLIGRRTVLTAGHCIPDSGAAPAFTVTTDGNERYEGASAVLHPQIDLGAQNFSDFDIAIVRLQRPVSGVVPTQLSFDPPLPGTTVTLVGYGIPGDSGLPGFKRTGQARLSQVDTYVFLHSREPARPTICSGDSGGPVLVDGAGGERVIGVNSAGTVPCDSGFGYGVHVRVDAHRAFIEREAGADLYTGGAIDIDAPEVTITSPAAGARPEPSFTLEADAVDAASGITRVELWIEGTRQGELSAAPYRFEVSGLERRCYDVEVRAVDGAENVGRATRQICIADGDPFGAPCQADATCGSGLCLGGACSQACTSLKPCPEGYDCTSNQCVAQPGAGGGCAAAPGAGVGRLLPLLLLSLLSLLALAFRRRLRRRCQTAARPRR